VSAASSGARHAQAGSDILVPGDGQLLVVAMPRTAGMLDLPAARAEANLLAARSGDVRLIDESTHVSSAFRLAGFPHVVATLWPIDDATAVAVAGTTYARLAGPTPDATPARALHRAVLEQRAAYAGYHPVRWAAHIHSGP